MNKTKKHELIRTVLFDYGGVLAEEGFRKGFEAIAIQTGLDPAGLYRLALEIVFNSGYVIGHCSEREFWKEIRKHSSLGNKSDAEYTQEILNCFYLRPQMMVVVRTLRSHGIVTAILSDQTNWLDRLEERDHFFHEFDHIFNSYHMGRSKRDPTLFSEVVKALDIKPQEALLVDNDRGNIRRASSLGLQTIFYHNYDSFIEEIEKFGV